MAAPLNDYPEGPVAEPWPEKSLANDRQVGGEHYKDGTKPEHWDLVAMYGWDYFTGQITKYLMRWRKKNGIEDLEKARHYLDKYIEVERSKILVKVDSEIDRVRGAQGKG